MSDEAPAAARPRSLHRLKRRAAPGAAPGTMVPDPEAMPTRLRVIAYGPDSLIEKECGEVGDLAHLVGQMPVVWVNVDGLGDHELMRQLGELFGLHSLSLEDIVNLQQRPKIEEFKDYLFIVMREAAVRPAAGLSTDQIAICLGENFVLTFQETHGDCFDPVRERIRKRRGRLRYGKADFLAYALLDAVIDNFFPVLEHYSDWLDRLEDALLSRPEPSLVAAIHALKRDLLALRRVVWPLREMLNALLRDEPNFIGAKTRIYLRDCYDHTVQLLDFIETYREIAADLTDIYLSNTNARINEVMKVLTIVSTIFIPLSFIASVYGMNFDTERSRWNMPELGWAYGYPFSLALMTAVALGLLLFFRRRGWLGQRRKARPADGSPRPRASDR